ncbi:uncharacterized protein LOC114784326 [Denticeps clupeoides]|uniref:uncharacterized protein LOC114784326 n=1 Tax=Denticeps clupeoides TaxID=299321 RepID=UPI0010A35CDA|nr:uncharacterized protein LOC114784326 [Denticeps clupeoides]
MPLCWVGSLRKLMAKLVLWCALFSLNDLVRCVSPEEPYKIISVTLGEPVTLKCSYNCSSGFVRAYWVWKECAGCNWTAQKINQTNGSCTLPLYTERLVLNQTHTNYTCNTEETDQPESPQKIHQRFGLRLNKSLRDASMKVLIHNKDENTSTEVGLGYYQFWAPEKTAVSLVCCATCPVEWINGSTVIKSKTLDLGRLRKKNTVQKYQCKALNPCKNEEITIEVKITTDKVLLLLILLVILLVTLTAYALYSIYKRKCRGKRAVNWHERSASKKENTPIVYQSSEEVPYAEIMISVRGASTPELTGLSDPRPRWREEPGPASLSAFRSADRLHVYPRDISRKMSTTSEYAIISYSTEGLGS